MECIYTNGTVTALISLFDKRGRDNKLPDGEITVWKLCKINKQPNNFVSEDSEQNQDLSKYVYVYVELLVPATARRITPYPNQHYKSRVEYAQVTAIIDKDGTRYQEAESFVRKNSILKYKVGEMVHPDKFNGSINESCGAGINVHLYKDQCDVWLDY